MGQTCCILMIQTIEIFFSLFVAMSGVNKSYPKQQRNKPNIYHNAMDISSDNSEYSEDMPPHLIDTGSGNTDNDIDDWFGSDHNAQERENYDHWIISRYKTEICCPLDNRRKKNIMRQINEQLFFDNNNVRIYFLKKNIKQMYYVVVADKYQHTENQIPHYYDEEYKTKEIEEMSQ